MRNNKGQFVKGFSVPKEWKQNHSKMMLGNKYSLGNKNWLGKHHTKETKNKMRQQHLGTHQTQETKKNQSKKMQILYGTPYYKKKFSNQWTVEKKIRHSIFMKKYWTKDKRIEQGKRRLTYKIPDKDTKPERMLQIALKIERINFQTHKSILGQPDIFIEPNICIFVDGDYWHANPKKFNSDSILTKWNKKLKASDIWKYDNQINHELNLHGYHVIRIWESDILSNINDKAGNIIKIIKQINPKLIKLKDET